MPINIEDASDFILDQIIHPRRHQYSNYGYDLYTPNVISAYIKENYPNPTAEDTNPSGTKVRELYPVFQDAVWELCRRGVLRIGVNKLGGQSTETGNGYSITEFGKSWVSDGEFKFIAISPGRLTSLFKKFSSTFGENYLIRCSEAALCYKFGSYLAACVMCGAAAESILLATAIAKKGKEDDILSLYKSGQGRSKTINFIVGQLPNSLSGQFQALTGLLSYWRDQASHGATTSITEIEAHEAISRLIRFSQFVSDNWSSLTSK